MLSYINTLSSTAAMLSLLTLTAASSFSYAQSQDEMSSETSLEVVQFAGAMHATSLTCDAYSEEKLLEYKREQQKRMEEQGMDEETFDEAFAAGRRQAAERWKGLSTQEQEQACKEIAEQASDMTPPSE
ncbi:hypothetical protein KEM63_13510 [Halopseudomonas nanhaiensis]|uniref:hypothetical protein n=1 Tax=Halopseudomonas nanhaiensis TaxID=2830842 RepID=UPI001CC1B43B|nr:hypothetical protein [Halopseudomonas nanhaiensis]UAW97803.1 hypothetical protein KEM63_13510 [Halopseudomonas nanhaiensis]